MSALISASRALLKESFHIYWILLRISLPLLIAIRLLDEYFGIVAIIGDFLGPLMSIVGLPSQTGIVWATAILLNLYASILVLVSLWTQLALSGAQVTILMLIILVAHALPVELRITQKAGVHFFAMLCVRIGGALMMGWLLHIIYDAGNWLQEPAQIFFQLPPIQSGWGPWFIGQAKNWAIVYVIITVLIVFIRFLKVTHIERLLIFLLSPLLRVMGIGKKAIAITMIGMTLGITYSSGLLINESKKGNIPQRDLLCTLIFLGLCHAVIEDSIIVMLTGAHVSGVLIGRIVFSFAFMFIFSQLIKYLPDTFLGKIMLKNH